MGQVHDVTVSYEVHAGAATGRPVGRWMVRCSCRWAKHFSANLEATARFAADGHAGLLPQTISSSPARRGMW